MSLNTRINKMWYKPKMKYYTIIKMNQLHLHANM